MSWSGFKKNVGRATTQVMMKTGHVEKTSDRSYEVEERRYRTLESASLRLQKEAKGYLDSLRAMTASQMRIAETIDAFYGDSGAQDGVSRSYKQAVEDLDAETVKALDGPYRCVPDSLYKFAGGDAETLSQIEMEWNFKAGNQRYFTRHAMAGFQEQCELMDFMYRATVLEPINRFCNYFPDINECIKKRQHKLLDYDALRAKVKKLTEKPDKDPGKLPRTEKESDMVGLHEFLHRDSFNANSRTTGVGQRYSSDYYREWNEDDLMVPSPPKALQRPQILKLREQQAQAPSRVSSMQLNHNPSTTNQAASADLARWSTTPNITLLQRSSSVATSVTGSSANTLGVSTEVTALSPKRSHHRASSSGIARSVSMQTVSPSLADRPSSSNPSVTEISPSEMKTRSRASSRSSLGRSLSRGRLPTPFLQPSELEEIMQPLKKEFMQKQADIYTQAKAAYEQLNEQLTTELPQLIDLRVPYLDPSFEALVKIQLRFCAEAYSRMAQVQQYLDASTRDQYASGDLDARVEDVLGQIRELSIAGTV